MISSKTDLKSPYGYALFLFGAVILLSVAAAIGHTGKISMVGVCHIIQVVLPLVAAVQIFRQQLLSRQQLLVGSALVLLSLADGMFYIIKYAFGFHSRDPIVELLTTLPYPVVNILCVVALAPYGIQIVKEWGAKYTLGACVIAAILWVPLTFSALSADSFANMGALQWALTISQPLITFLLTCLGALLLVFVRSLHWNALALGVLCLALGDWAIQVENIFKVKASISLNTYIWTMASFTFCLPAIVSGLQGKASIFKSDSKSLVVNSRLWLLVGITVPVSLFSVLWEGKWQMIAFVALTILMIAIVVFISTSYFLNALEKTEFALAEGNNFDHLLSDTSDIPSELRNGIVSVHLRQIQIEKIRSEQEAEKAAATEILAKSVAHDLGGPLTALKVLSEVNRDSDEGKLMQSVIERIELIAADLLSRYRPIPASSGVSLSLHRIIESTLEFKKIEWTRNVLVQVSTIPSNTVIDSSIQLERILSNIFQNAYEALLFKEDALIKVAYQEQAEHFSISVSDNGIGIPDQIKSSIGVQGFTTKSSSNGNGIGLYSGLNHLKNKGGDLIVHSVEGKGTEVVLLIPKRVSINVSKVENA